MESGGWCTPISPPQIDETQFNPHPGTCRTRKSLFRFDRKLHKDLALHHWRASPESAFLTVAFQALMLRRNS
jgi:hypothetical protein